MMNNEQKSAIYTGIKRIFFPALPVMMMTVVSCTAQSGDRQPRNNNHHKPVETAPAAISRQQELRCSPGFDTAALRHSVDSLVVYKAHRTMDAYAGRRKLKTYVISLGQAPEGPKQRKGDLKTPEGLYCIDGRNAASAYHRNLSVSYPNAADRSNARRKGYATGGDIKIHGLPQQRRHAPEAYLYSDWTWGCIAVSDREIEELFTYVQPGTPILIEP
ncbi:L,D-transpeptidase family protein [Taibaiella chishuiensis]|uniref:L,D-transpeptidase-like protein n=1 Tax=Taibaiella chishuiensis TaxID=1434707 RepID=A0A2P8D440_9BACT|nr:L,D-transpeptidase family protein [Taibaiella chishuiensis]PSK91976.1 L,D-transpeptidase-like protein [Taibaiella chishuiensis]